MPHIPKSLLILALSLGFFISACAADAVNDPPAAVLGYLDALVAMDENRMINSSCSGWEEQARLEHKSFAAVKADLVSPACSVSGDGEEYTLVSCTGKIIANYGAEDLEIDLAERTYKLVQEGGEWRICGYE